MLGASLKKTDQLYVQIPYTSLIGFSCRSSSVCRNAKLLQVDESKEDESATTKL